MKNKFVLTMILFICVLSNVVFCENVFDGKIIGTDENQVDTKLPDNIDDTDKHIKFNDQKFKINNDNKFIINESDYKSKSENYKKITIEDNNKKEYKINDKNKKEYKVKTETIKKPKKNRFLYYILGIAGVLLILA